MLLCYLYLLLLTSTFIIINNKIDALESYKIILNKNLLTSKVATNNNITPGVYHIEQEHEHKHDNTYFKYGFETYHINGFVQTVELAYYNHLILVLKPTDIWHIIMTTMSHYIANYIQSFHMNYVIYRMKWKSLNKKNTSQQDWYDIINEVATKSENGYIKLGSQFNKAYTSNFTTVSNKYTRLFSQLITRPVSRQYGEHNISVYSYSSKSKNHNGDTSDTRNTNTINGEIPAVELLGKIEDWTMLSNKLKRLGLLNPIFNNKLVAWHKSLEYIIDQLIKARKGYINRSFWQSFCPTIILQLYHLSPLENSPSPSSAQPQASNIFPLGIVEIPFYLTYFKSTDYFETYLPHSKEKNYLSIYCGFGSPFIDNLNNKVESSLYFKLVGHGEKKIPKPELQHYYDLVVQQVGDEIYEFYREPDFIEIHSNHA